MIPSFPGARDPTNPICLDPRPSRGLSPPSQRSGREQLEDEMVPTYRSRPVRQAAAGPVEPGRESSEPPRKRRRIQRLNKGAETPAIEIDADDDDDALDGVSRSAAFPLP